MVERKEIKRGTRIVIMAKGVSFCLVCCSKENRKQSKE